MSRSPGKKKIKKHLSAEELKSKLYEHFEENGSLDQIKTQLRGELYTKLLKNTPNDFPETTRDFQNFDKMLLPLQVSNWLVFDHLLRQDYQYTLSTFTSEAKLSSPDKLLTACDILRLFGIENTSSAYRTISKKYVTTNEKGVLNSLLLAAIKCMFEMPNKNCRLNELLSDTEVTNSELVDHKGSSGNPEKSCEVDEKNKIGGLSFSEKLTLNQLTADNKQTEKSFHEQLHFIKKEKEKEVQKLREKLLEELDRLREMQLELEHEKNDLRRQRTSISHNKDILQEKKMLLEKELENKFQKELHELEIDFKSQLHLKETEMDGLQKQIATKGQKLFELELDLKSYKDRCNGLENDLADQREMYKVIQEKYSLLFEENIKLQRNCEGMSDYFIIKDELNVKIKENIELQNKLMETVRIAEIEKQKSNETLKDLEEKLKAKDPELLQAQKDLNSTKETLHKQESFWSKERKKLEQELQNSKQMYNTIFLRLEEQREDIHDLHKTIHFLQYQISNTFPVNKTKSETPEMLQKYTSVESTRKGIQDLRNKNNRSLGDFALKYRENSLNFISEAKGRIDRLEKEAEMVKDKYSYMFRNTAQLDFNSTIPKATFSNIYNFPTNSFTNSTYSQLPSNYFDNLVKNEMSFLNLKSATNIKRMVSNPQFSTNLFSSGQENEQIRSRNDQSNETTITGWKEPLKELQKDHVTLNDAFSEKETNSNTNNAKERVDTSTHFLNFSNTKMKALHKEVPLASLNLDFTMPSAAKSLTNNEKSEHDITKPKEIPENLSDIQETSESVPENVTDSEAIQSEVASEEMQRSTPISYENTVSENTSLPAIDRDAAGKENKTLSESPKKQDSVTVLENDETLTAKEDDLALDLVVDLDAAWKKRKSSTSGLSFKKSSPNLKPQNGASSVENKNSDIKLLNTVPQQDVNNKNVQNLKHDGIDNQTTDTIAASLENEPRLTALGQTAPKVIQNLDTNLTEEVTVKSSEKGSGDASNKSSVSNYQEALQNIARKQNENKSLKSGSGSELSDVQLSCGSEQEAKEEDDFW